MNAPTKRADFIDANAEAEAVRKLRESILAVDPDDAELLTDMIEGETRFFDLVDALLRRMVANRALANGLALAIEDMKARKDRFEKREETDRALIEQAMAIAELPKIERPVGTLSLSARAPKLVIETEADIPAAFWKTGAPTLDKKALTEALKARAEAIAALPEDAAARTMAIASLPPEIPGAVLSNGAPSLTVRFK